LGGNRRWSAADPSLAASGVDSASGSGSVAAVFYLGGSSVDGRRSQGGVGLWSAMAVSVGVGGGVVGDGGLVRRGPVFWEGGRRRSFIGRGGEGGNSSLFSRSVLAAIGVGGGIRPCLLGGGFLHRRSVATMFVWVARRRRLECAAIGIALQ